MERYGAPLLMLGLPMGAVLAVEFTPVWAALGAALHSVDFDAARTALILAWSAGVAVALLAALLTGMAWRSSLAAFAFVGVTYALPWAWQAAHPAAAPFASAPQPDWPALLARLGAILGVALLAAVPAAATGLLLRSSLSRLLTAPRPPRAGLACAAVLALLATALALASGIDPALRYGPDHGLYAAARSGPAGHVLYRTLSSPATGSRRTFAVYLPPGYSTRDGRRYPVVYLLHGDPGSYRDWVNLGAPQMLDGGIRTGALAPAILVMPDGNGQAIRASQWADSLDGRERVETSVLELVHAIDRDYRSRPSPSGRIVAGLSSGGFGAANLAARHPDLFGSAVSLSGYFRAQGAMFGGDQAYLNANSPSYVVRHHAAARSVRYLLVAGWNDSRYRSAADAFASQLASQGVRHDLILLQGAHESRVWTHGLAASLQRVIPTGSPPVPASSDLGGPVGLLSGLAPLGTLLARGSRGPAPPADRSRLPGRVSRVLGAATRAGGRLGWGLATPAVRGLLATAAVVDAFLATDAWLVRHHALHTGVALALTPLAPLRLLVGGSLAAVALFVASRERRSFRYLLVGLAAAGGILAVTAAQPLLIAVAGIDCILVLLASSLWPASSHGRSSVAGWTLLISAAAVTVGLFMFQHPSHKLASVLTLVLVMAFAAAVSGLMLIDRNAQLPWRSDVSRARRLHDETAELGVSPFALVGRKRHLWARDGSAFIAYGCRAGVALALGAAMGSPDASGALQQSFRRACRRRGWRPALYQVSARVTRELGWGHRYLLGSEAIVDLTDLSLEGPRFKPLRGTVARARRSGVEVEVTDEIDAATAAALRDLAAERARRRRLGDMAFSVGRRTDPCHVRRTYGIARDAEGSVTAYTTWLWMPGASMVVLDEVQRAPNAPPGTADLLIYTCLAEFRPAARQASLGLAPIAGSTQAERLARVEALVRRLVGHSASAPGLYSFKAKFNPVWEPRYVVAERWIDWPAVWLAVFLVHFPDFMQRWTGPLLAPRSSRGPATG